MNITKKIVDEYLKKSEELEKTQKSLSDLIIDAKKGKKEPVSFMRKDAKGEMTKLDIKEENLWDEIYILGEKAGQARNYLRIKYPKVFEEADREKEMAADTKKYAFENFGVDTKKMRLSDIIRLIVAITEERRY